MQTPKQRCVPPPQHEAGPHLCVLGAGLLFLYTAKLLGRCMADAAWILTYPDIGEHAFGLRGRLLISIMLYSELYIT